MQFYMKIILKLVELIGIINFINFKWLIIIPIFYSFYVFRCCYLWKIKSLYRIRIDYRISIVRYSTTLELMVFYLQIEINIFIIIEEKNDKEEKLMNHQIRHWKIIKFLFLTILWNYYEIFCEIIIFDFVRFSKIFRLKKEA